MGLFCFVRKQEARVSQYAGTGAYGRHQKRVFIKSMLYISAGFPACIICLLHSLASYGVIEVDYQSLMYATVSILPLPGVLNVLIYSNFFNVFKEKTASFVESVRGSIRTSFVESGHLTSTQSNYYEVLFATLISRSMLVVL